MKNIIKISLAVLLLGGIWFYGTVSFASSLKQGIKEKQYKDSLEIEVLKKQLK